MTKEKSESKAFSGSATEKSTARTDAPASSPPYALGPQDWRDIWNCVDLQNIRSGGRYKDLIVKLRVRGIVGIHPPRPSTAHGLPPEVEEVFHSLICARYNDVVEGELENARRVIGSFLQRSEVLP